MRKLFAILVFLALAACQTVPPDQMSPTQFTFNYEKQRVKEAIAAVFIQDGYTIVQDSDLVLTMDRPTDNIGAALLLGSRFNAIPNARAMMTFISSNPVIVQVNMALITNPGSGFEKRTRVDNEKDRATIVDKMERAKALLAAN